LGRSATAKKKNCIGVQHQGYELGVLNVEVQTYLLRVMLEVVLLCQWVTSHET
jgi:hypothetical protein